MPFQKGNKLGSKSTSKKDIKGQVFGRYTVLEDAGRDKWGAVLWRCKCECGNEKVVWGSHLRSGHVVSCGCYKLEKAKSLTGERNPRWKGGRYIRPDGYIRLSIKGKTFLEHRLVMEKHLGRKLKTIEEVHHIDCDKTNNDITNLQVMSVSEHAAFHHKVKNVKQEDNNDFQER